MKDKYLTYTCIYDFFKSYYYDKTKEINRHTGWLCTRLTMKNVFISIYHESFIEIMLFRRIF